MHSRGFTHDALSHLLLGEVQLKEKGHFATQFTRDFVSRKARRRFAPDFSGWYDVPSIPIQAAEIKPGESVVPIQFDSLLIGRDAAVNVSNPLASHRLLEPAHGTQLKPLVAIKQDGQGLVVPM